MFAPHYLYMRQCLTVKYKTLTSLHGIIHVEVLHTQDVPVNVESLKVPLRPNSQILHLRDDATTYQIIAPRASVALS